MPRKQRKAKKPEDEHTHLAVRVDRYDAHVSAGINHNAYQPQYAFDLDEDDPLYRFTTHLEIVGTCTYPEVRAGDEYLVTIYGEDAPSMGMDRTLKSIQARDEHHAPVYRTYRGKRVPVFIVPKGMGLLEKIRGQARWTAWLHAAPRFVSDALVVLAQRRQVYVAIHERREQRSRWVQSLSVQTTDPAEE